MARVVVIDRDLCKPSKCNLECIRFCPINRTKSVKAVELDQESKRAVIKEEVCIGCGICVKKCPSKAISVVNVPDEVEKNVVHRYGENMFKLYNLPTPRLGGVLGVIGRNGSGKTTCIRILSGGLKPNLGRWSNPPDWDEIIAVFRGREIQNYLRKIADGKLRSAIKIQYVGYARSVLKGRVIDLLRKADERGMVKEVVDKLGLKHLLDRDVRELSGGELQKFLVAATLLKNTDAYFFDEPCSYLDIRERVRVAEAIREFIDPDKKYIVVVEHDLTVLDYVSDYVSVIYGEPGVYGIVSSVYSVRTGINNYLEGYLPAENMRIRKEPIVFRTPSLESRATGREYPLLKWSKLVKTYESSGFELVVEEGDVYASEVIGIVGPNGIGKSTFINLLAGVVKPDSGEVLITSRDISYKAQEVTPQIFRGETVRETLESTNKLLLDPSNWLYDELVRGLGLNKLLYRKVRELSGGELQKLAIASTLGVEADIYLLDEPSAYLDVEERYAVAKLIKRIIEERGKVALVVEHDLMMLNYMCTRLMVFTGEPGVRGEAGKPISLVEGFNDMLKEINVTMRKDIESGRPRVNKPGSVLDREQKSTGKYYVV
ncbi:MAG: ribosome biogenesis/translation initiation ATPase RLI [Desulfurococcaceae archaeon]